MLRNMTTYSSILWGWSLILGCGENPELEPDTSPVIETFTFEYSFSCHNPTVVDNTASYGASALYLTESERTSNDPALIYNGACHADNIFDAHQNGGDDRVGIVNLGEISLYEVEVQMVSDASLTQTSIIEEGATYGLWLDTDNMRAIVALKVLSHIQDGPLEVEYTVLELQEGHFEAPWIL